MQIRGEARQQNSVVVPCPKSERSLTFDQFSRFATVSCTGPDPLAPRPLGLGLMGSADELGARSADTPIGSPLAGFPNVSLWRCLLLVSRGTHGIIIHAPVRFRRVGASRWLVAQAMPPPPPSASPENVREFRSLGCVHPTPESVPLDIISLAIHDDGGLASAATDAHPGPVLKAQRPRGYWRPGTPGGSILD